METKNQKQNEETDVWRVCIIIQLKLREKRKLLWLESPTHIPRLISRRPPHTPPLLDAREYHVHHLIHQLMRLVSPDRNLDTARCSLLNPKLRHTFPHARDLRPRPRYSLKRRTCRKKVRRLLDALRDVRRQRDGEELGHIVEVDVLLDGAEGIATAGPTKGTVLVVRGGAIPAAQPLANGGLALAGGSVVVGQGQQIRGDGALPRLLQSWAVEGAGYEVTRNRVGGGRGLDGVEGTTEVLWWVVLISG